MITRSALINVMASAASFASRNINRDFGEIQNLQASKKSPLDFLAETEKRAETSLFRDLRKARPNFEFHMKKSGKIQGPDTSNCWLIDPLAGKLNFLHGIPLFAISIALIRDNEIFAALIYDPVGDHTFWAELGGGAYLGNRKLRVSNRNELSQCLFSTGDTGVSEKHSVQVNNVTAASTGVRSFGVPALDLTNVAAGRIDGYWADDLDIWESEIGGFIVKEAGGLVTDSKEKSKTKLTSPTGTFIASNADIHTAFCKIIE